ERGRRTEGFNTEATEGTEDGGRPEAQNSGDRRCVAMIQLRGGIEGAAPSRHGLCALCVLCVENFSHHRPPFSVFYLRSPVLRLRSSVLGPRSSVLGPPYYVLVGYAE